MHIILSANVSEVPLNKGHTENMLRSLFSLSFFLSPCEDDVSMGSSQPRDRTRVSYIAGRFFTM